MPKTRKAASEALDAYAEANPAWREARRMASRQKGRETRMLNLRTRIASGEEPEFDAQLQEYRRTAIKRWGRDPMELPATLKTLARLRQAARRLPQDDSARISAYTAMKAGISQDAASTRIRHLTQDSLQKAA